MLRDSGILFCRENLSVNLLLESENTNSTSQLDLSYTLISMFTLNANFLENALRLYEQEMGITWLESGARILNGLSGFNPNLTMKWITVFPVLTGIELRRLYRTFTVNLCVGAAFQMFQVRSFLCFERGESF